MFKRSADNTFEVEQKIDGSRTQLESILFCNARKRFMISSGRLQLYRAVRGRKREH